MSDDIGKKNDHEKLDWTLLPFDALENVVKVLEFGKNKYSRDNWKNVEPHRERYGAALLRHFIAWYGGQDKDAESGQSHLAHLVCCALFLLWHEHQEMKR